MTEAMERNIAATEIGSLSALNKKAKLYEPLRIPTKAKESQADFFHAKYLVLFFHAVGNNNGRTIKEVNKSQDAEKCLSR